MKAPGHAISADNAEGVLLQRVGSRSRWGHMLLLAYVGGLAFRIRECLSGFPAL